MWVGSWVAAILAGPGAGGAGLLVALTVCAGGGVLWLICSLAVDPRATIACERLDAARGTRQLAEDDDPGAPDPTERVHIWGGQPDWGMRADARH